MSNFSNYAENKLADMVRGQAWSLPTNLYVGLASAADDGGITELSGTGYARQSAPRALATWAGTQGAGSTLASSGTSHATSNNVAFNFGTAGSGWGTASHAALFDASTAGNAIAYLPLPSPLAISSGNPVSITAGALSATLGLAGGCTDYLANKLIDFILRGQAFAFPASMYAARFTAAPSNAGGGTEVSGGGYARPAIAGSLAAWSGTQGAGTTAASTGTGGTISNNVPIAFPAPTADQGASTHGGLFDAATTGNLLMWAPLASPQTVSAGGPAPTYDPGAFEIAFA